MGVRRKGNDVSKLPPFQSYTCLHNEPPVNGKCPVCTRAKWVERDDLEKTLLTIRDKWLPETRRDMNYPNKLTRALESIKHEIAKVMSPLDFPEPDNVEDVRARGGSSK